MRFTKLTLYTNSLSAEKDFYTQALGLPLTEEDNSSFTVQVGWSQLTFQESAEAHCYHYCFLIPANQLHEALGWMQERLTVLEIEPGQKTVRFEDWNADSLYFHDASGNIAELITRPELNNQSEEAFGAHSFLCVNEVGMPCLDIARLDKELSDLMGTIAWKGNVERFGTHGDQEGIFLLPQYQRKDTWFPTGQKIKPEPFGVTVKVGSKEHRLRFENEKLSVK